MAISLRALITKSDIALVQLSYRYTAGMAYDVQLAPVGLSLYLA